MTEKKFRIDASKIAEIATGHGSCFATDRITVDGLPVGYCYREEPDSKTDSGWRFFAGDEDDAYLESAENIDIYDVNTIANYDQGIIPLLDAPIGSAFGRGEDNQFFAE